MLATFAPPITVFIYIHGDELSCRLPATPSRLCYLRFRFSLLPLQRSFYLSNVFINANENALHLIFELLRFSMMYVLCNSVSWLNRGSVHCYCMFVGILAIKRMDLSHGLTVLFCFAAYFFVLVFVIENEGSLSSPYWPERSVVVNLELRRNSNGSFMPSASQCCREQKV
ncbi:hypothetical protein DOE54_14265 [Vibrio cholerae]|nr:hypothetical protein [Vibrio cholerae]RAL28130.1 hypothetical protein DOE54_14265 [Vibrio cholerae]TLE27482.1 hypothetical protein D2926_03730 [Vibrio cholerae]TLE33791.1 hypothetical protein D2927_03750 [Vibrio cholerae]TLE38118.1 hypothetical protein D2928_01375 [Vibrio cholerae]